MLILADDLTGAADCGVACTEHGMLTEVALATGDLKSEADCLAVDANTRAMSPDDARKTMARLARMFLSTQSGLVYKKVDSTLRGNVGTELAAVLNVQRTLRRDGGRIVSVLAPAFPAAGRTTLIGRQYVDGIPLHGTAAWQHESSPPPVTVHELMHRTGMRPILIPITDVRAGWIHLEKRMRTAAQEADVLICDAETEQDMKLVAETGMTLGPHTVWAGSAGLAHHLPLAAGFAQENRPPRIHDVAEGPVVVVAGSSSSITRAQVEALAQVEHLELVVIPPEVLLGNEDAPDWLKAAETIRQAMDAGLDIVIQPSHEPQMERRFAGQIASGLSRMTKPVRDNAGGLVVTGGETARALFDAWGIGRLRLHGQVEPGLPFAVAQGWARPLPVLTKAGAFGTPQTLVYCRTFLKGLNREGSAIT